MRTRKTMSTRCSAWCNSPTCPPPGASTSRSNCTSVGNPSWALSTAQRARAKETSMAANKRQEFIIALCQEAGDTGPPDVLVEDWEANHACCCALHLGHAVQADPK